MSSSLARQISRAGARARLDNAVATRHVMVVAARGVYAQLTSAGNHCALAAMTTGFANDIGLVGRK